ncbi:MAG: ornithine cyclodeaminase family protein [Fimbriimonadia bacterium]
MPLLLTRADVERCLSMGAAIEAVEMGFRRLSAGEVVMPQRTVTPVVAHDGTLLCMPAYVESQPEVLCVKVVTAYGQNIARHSEAPVQGVVLLHRPETGRLIAIIEAEYLTAVRTGAAGGVAAKVLACADATVATVFGVGAQARTQLIALSVVRPLRSVFVLSKHDPRTDSFCHEMATLLGCNVLAATDPEEAVRRSDVIITATNATEPVFRGEWLRPGTHVTAVGAFTRSTRELDSETVRRSKLYVDHRAAALLEAGDVLIPLGEGAIAPDHIVGEVGEVLLGLVPGRTQADEITVFKSVGLAVQDAMVANSVYQRAIELGLGTEVPLE